MIVSGGLPEAITRLLRHAYGSTMQIYRTSGGTYGIGPHGSAEHPQGERVISHSQLSQLMWASGIIRDDLDDDATVARLVELICDASADRGPSR